jgi:hypothetical protein
MDAAQWLVILLGIGVLILIALAALRGEFREIERPKYEMLGRAPPADSRPARPGRVGVEDRVIRIGLAIPFAYYASRLGWLSAAGMVLTVVAVYLGATALVGRDYLYKLLRLDTRLPEHR